MQLGKLCKSCRPSPLEVSLRRNDKENSFLATVLDGLNPTLFEFLLKLHLLVFMERQESQCLHRLIPNWEQRKMAILEYLMDTMTIANCRNESGAQLYVVSGPVMQEVTVLCKDLTISAYILLQGYTEALSAVYLTNSVKPQGTKFGEFFMSFQTDLETREKSFNDDSLEPTFFTDTGIAVEKRMKVSRLPYEGKYVPCNKLCLYPRRTGGTRFSFWWIVHGFTSTKSGQLEAIFDRRLPYDDARVLDEGVNDPEDMVSNYVLLQNPY
ncbi:Alpha-mannosidase 2 [Orchesella cincta]|uniref:Alpha-mannosidase 2 n=1 Tax=Orchesella cincta TaxID=48709 RepID=A0A1D2MNE9_ORCCI|nr:Alpha-mannosidase 2 [Orchesella cincta]